MQLCNEKVIVSDELQYQNIFAAFKLGLIDWATVERLVFEDEASESDEKCETGPVSVVQQR